MESSQEQSVTHVEQSSDTDPDISHAKFSNPHTTQHDHSDSMVTIRLSSTQKANDIMASAEEQPEDYPVPNGEEVTLEFPDDVEMRRDSGQSIEDALSDTATEFEEAEMIALHRVSKVRFDMRSTNDELVHADDVDTMQPEDVIRTSSRISSQASFSPTIIEESNTLEAEMERHVARQRAQSDGSSDSGSGQVDWAELEKNEEQEKRDEGTDEVFGWK